ncbi:RNA polymerase sigma-70 factor [Reichenbachiella sp. MALMAid0571]|uniref:RNA polymerase sigma-70 factor n=1 Tax=Reichenbachiella sp. MALMAid0571 TaxID=3143939 RepID=UPI0032DFF380
MTALQRINYLNWINALRTGDGGAFENIYNEFWESLYAIAYNRLKSREAVEEILQEIFTDLWNRRESLSITSSLPAYLHAALKYKILNYIHSQKLRLNFSQDHPEYIYSRDNSTQEVLAFEELYELLEMGLEKLPAKCRLVFRMSRQEQKSSKEIAAELNVSHRTVQTHIHQAIKFLRKELVDYKYVVLMIYLFEN